MDRERWFQILIGEEYRIDESYTGTVTERIPLPLAAAEALAFDLSVKWIERSDSNRGFAVSDKNDVGRPTSTAPKLASVATSDDGDQGERASPNRIGELQARRNASSPPPDQDWQPPVLTGGFKPVRHPERITAIISQNGNAYEEGLSDGSS
jgi:hypothetical protein